MVFSHKYHATIFAKKDSLIRYNQTSSNYCLHSGKSLMGFCLLDREQNYWAMFPYTNVCNPTVLVNSNVYSFRLSSDSCIAPPDFCSCKGHVWAQESRVEQRAIVVSNWAVSGQKITFPSGWFAYCPKGDYGWARSRICAATSKPSLDL